MEFDREGSVLEYPMPEPFSWFPGASSEEVAPSSSGPRRPLGRSPKLDSQRSSGDLQLWKSQADPQRPVLAPFTALAAKAEVGPAFHLLS